MMFERLGALAWLAWSAAAPHVAGSSYVITGAELRQGGSESLAEALRQIPGMHVRTLSAAASQAAARGFVDDVGDRLLVLVDGRPVASNLFGATFYEALPLALTDIDRIEVSLGPVSSTWGSGSTAGMVHIITRRLEHPANANAPPYLHRADARSTLGSAGDARLSARYAASHDAWQVHATALWRNLTSFADNTTEDAQLASARVGGGYDDGGNAVAVEAALSHGRIAPLAYGLSAAPFVLSHYLIQARGAHALQADGAFNQTVLWQAFYNAATYDSAVFPATGLFEGSPGLRVIHRIEVSPADLALRTVSGIEVGNTDVRGSLLPAARALVAAAAFVNQTVQWHDLQVQGNLRVDWQSLTHVNLSPEVTATWTIAGQRLSATVGGAYKNPALLALLGRFSNGAAPVLGNANLPSEHLFHAQVGYVGTWERDIEVRATGFAYGLRDATVLSGGMFATHAPWWGYGGEVAASLRITLRTAVDLSYSVMAWTQQIPQQQATVAWQWLPETYGFFARLHGQYVSSSAPLFATSQSTNDDFFMFTGRLGWQLENGFEVSLAGTNLIDERVVQFAAGEAPRRRILFTVAYSD